MSGLKSTVVTAVAVTPGGGSVFLAAAEAMTAGWGGIAAVSRITGIARSTIGRGLAELRGTAPPEAALGRVHRKGAGRPALADSDPTLLADLVALVEPSTRGDPMGLCGGPPRACATLAGGRTRPPHHFQRGRRLLRGLGYSLQANRKTREGTNHPDRDAQFGYINDQVQTTLTSIAERKWAMVSRSV